MLKTNSTVTGKMTVHSEGNPYGEHASVFLPSCVNVSTSGEATCFEEAHYRGWEGQEGQEVDTSRRPATREGTYMCAVSADSNTNDNTSSELTLTASLVVLLAVTTSFMV